MRWSEIETLKFVNIYLRHEYLWNPYDSGYKCRSKRQEAYKDIITGFRSATGILMDEVDLRVKIKNLRSTYAQELAKIKQRTGPDFVYTPNIKWFSEWHRCFSAIKQREYGAMRQSVHDTNQNLWSHQPNDLAGKLGAVVTESGDYFPMKMEPSPDRNLDSYKIKRRKIKHRKQSSIYQNPNTGVNEDEFDIYGKFIATQLRTMDLQRALRVQLDIHSIVSEARMSSLAANQL